MRQEINKGLHEQLRCMLIPTSSKGKRHAVATLASALLFIIAISTILTGLVLAQELPYPNPILPKNGQIGIDVSVIPFSWTPFYVGTNKYAFELSTNDDMSNPIVKTNTTNGSTTYEYRGKLEYNTTYWWRIMASEPLGGEWSPVSSFKTKAAPASTNNVTKPQDSTSKSFLSSIIAFLENIGWPMVGLIAGAIIIVIIAITVLAKPKGKPSGPGQWQGMQPPPQTQQPLICSTCGFQNSPERKFCSNCGAGLVSRGPQQPPWGAQQMIACPACGFTNAKGVKFCSNCGAGLVSRGPQQPPWGAQQPNACPACGLANPPGQRFCNSCGTSLAGGGQQQQQQQQQWQVYQTFTCPICGAPINKGINPCPNCRTWLDWGA